MLKYLQPSRTIPHTTWTAGSRWDLSLSRLIILVLGLFLFGIGESLYIQSNLGNSPWAVFADGVAKLTGTTIAWSTFVISCVVFLLWIPLKEKYGIGPIANTLIVPFAMNVGLNLIPRQESVVNGVLFLIIGIACVGLGSAIYITCGLGAGPRQGMMTALHRITGIRVARIATSIEVVVFTLGVLMGGKYGIGTLVFAVCIGPAVAIGFSIMREVGGTPTHEQHS
ncbi:MAG: YczE/YyaS/YitT family protein [Roseiflexaceae bacterium]